jgi:hypothetical protein
VTELLLGQRLAFGLLEMPLPGGAGDERNVASHEAASLRVGERAADDQVNLVHRLGGQRAARLRVEKRVVERLDLLVAQPSEPDPSEDREDVSLHVALVAAVGAGREVSRFVGNHWLVR